MYHHAVSEQTFKEWIEQMSIIQWGRSLETLDLNDLQSKPARVSGVCAFTQRICIGNNKLEVNCESKQPACTDSDMKQIRIVDGQLQIAGTLTNFRNQNVAIQQANEPFGSEMSRRL